MGGDEKFSLRWNDFERSLSSSFQQFRDQLQVKKHRKPNKQTANQPIKETANDQYAGCGNILWQPSGACSQTGPLCLQSRTKVRLQFE